MPNQAIACLAQRGFRVLLTFTAVLIDVLIVSVQLYVGLLSLSYELQQATWGSAVPVSLTAAYCWLRRSTLRTRLATTLANRLRSSQSRSTVTPTFTAPSA